MTLTLQQASSVGYRVSLYTYSYYRPSSYYLAIKWKIKAHHYGHHLEQPTDFSAVPIACPQNNAWNCPDCSSFLATQSPAWGGRGSAGSVARAKPTCPTSCVLQLLPALSIPVALRPHCLDFSGVLLMVQKFQTL